MSYKYFENRACEYYPCHKMEHMNCLFCYCPLYLTEECGGNYRIIEPSGIKDCSNCTFPHHAENYEKVIERFRTAAKKQGESRNSR